MTTYTRSYSTDFGSSLSNHQMEAEIVGDTTITTTITEITRNDDVVDIVFTSAISTAEETQLNALIAAHTPVERIRQAFTMTLHTFNVTSDQTYTMVGGCPFEGSIHVGTISKFVVYSWMDVGVTNYKVRILDANKGTVLAEITASNTTQAENILTNLSIPTTNTYLECHLWKNSGENKRGAHIESVNFYT